MESQVQELLQEERKVNTQVKQALQAKREKLATITEHTERAVANEKRELQEELNQKIAQVREVLIDSISPQLPHTMDVASLWSLYLSIYLLTPCLFFVLQKRAMMDQEGAGSTEGASMKVVEAEFERNKQSVIEMLI